MVYSDIRVLQVMYLAYIKSLLEDNEIVLILTYYDHLAFRSGKYNSDFEKNKDH